MKRSFFFAGLGLTAFVIPGGLSPQSTPSPTVQGAVRTETGEPVAGVRVEIRGLGVSTTTRADGSFRFQGIKPGRYWVTAIGGGVEPARKSITVGSDPGRAVDFHLEPLTESVAARRAAELDSLDRGFAERMRSSLDGIFLTRDDIERSRQPQLGAVLATYLIQTSPRSAIRGGGANCAPFESWVSQQSAANARFQPDPQAYPYISVNGARPFRARALYEFDPADVEALEFYRGAGPTTGYIPTSTQCGLVIIWTK